VPGGPGSRQGPCLHPSLPDGAAGLRFGAKRQFWFSCPGCAAAWGSAPGWDKGRKPGAARSSSPLAGHRILAEPGLPPPPLLPCYFHRIVRRRGRMFPAFFLFASKGCGVGGEMIFLAGSCAIGTVTAFRSTVPLRPGQGADASWPETSPRSPLLCTVLAVEMRLIPCPRWQPVGSGTSSCARRGLGDPSEEMLLQRGF